MRRRNRREYSDTRKGNLFVVAVIVLCFAVTLGLSLLFSGKGFLSLAEVFGKESESTFYAVAIGGYEDMTLARSTAGFIKERGGAGYVTSDVDSGGIDIIINVYKDKSSAESVLAGLDNRSAYIKEIKAQNSKYSWCDGETKKAVKQAIEYFDIAFDSLYNTASNLNDNKMSVDDAKTQIRVLYAQIEDIKSVFYQNTIGTDKSQITEIKLALITTLALLDNIEYGNVAKTCSSLRYAMVQLVLCHQSLLKTV